MDIRDAQIGREFEERIEGRIGQDFDGECDLTEDEAKAVLRLIRAGRIVIQGLWHRIENADQSSVPVFDGICDLSDALRAFAPETIE